MSPRIALLGFSIECNRFAPPATEADFARSLLAGRRGASLDGRPQPRPRGPRRDAGLRADMDATGPWQPAPLMLAMAEPNGPVEHAFFDAHDGELARGRWPRAPARPGLDGAFCVMHGAGLTTELDDPEGAVQALVREILGASVPLSAATTCTPMSATPMVALNDAFVGYRTNPHLDMRARGAESRAAAAPPAGRRALRIAPSPPAHRGADRLAADGAGALCRGDRPRPGRCAAQGPAHRSTSRSWRLRLWRHALQRHVRHRHRD